MDLSAALKNKDIILLDGAIGTELDKRGLMGRASNNLDSPEVVLEIQREYAQCGCDALTTNTLTMNRIYIETHNVGVSVRDVNRAGVELARQAVGKAQYVLGDISSTGQLLEPYGSLQDRLLARLNMCLATSARQASCLSRMVLLRNHNFTMPSKSRLKFWRNREWTVL